MTAPQEDPFYRWGVLTIVVMGTVMAILDTSIVNVALPHMMSAFSVDRNKIEWVSTAFMITSASAMPLVGWINHRVGYRTLYLTCLTIFTLASGLCALAWNFESMIGARVLQAAGGGAIMPIGMAIVADLFPPHERGKALGIWGAGIMVGPAIGPTLGGYLTDYFNWRAIFSVNLPFGILTLAAGLIYIRRPTHLPPARRFDLAGYLALAVGLIFGLVALSNGQEKGWDSTYILTCAGISAVALVLFLGLEWDAREPIFNLRLLLIGNYTVCLILALTRAIGLFGSVFLLPIYLQTLAGYTTIQAGLWTVPGAISVGVAMPIAGRLSDRYPPGPLAAFGIIIMSLSLFANGYLDPLASWHWIIWPQVVRGFGLAFLMAPMTTAALNAVPPPEIPMASSFINVAQNVGGAAGIAMINTYVTGAIQDHAVRLGELFATQSQRYGHLADQAAGLVLRRAPGLLPTAELKSLLVASHNVLYRAEVQGYDNGFVFAGWIVLLALPLCYFLKAAAHHARSRPGEAKPIVAE